MQGIRIFMLCMMMRLTALMTYCWMACVLASCVGSASSDAIEVNLLHTDVDTIAYSAFVDSIEYIPLETTEECLVGEVTDVVMAGDPDGNVFVMSQYGEDPDSNPVIQVLHLK